MTAATWEGQREEWTHRGSGRDFQKGRLSLGHGYLSATPYRAVVSASDNLQELVPEQA